MHKDTFKIGDRVGYPYSPWMFHITGATKRAWRLLAVLPEGGKVIMIVPFKNADKLTIANPEPSRTE